MRIRVVVLLLLLTPTTVYSRMYTSVRVGGQHQVGKVSEKAIRVSKISGKKSPNKEERIVGDCLNVLQKLYESFYRHVRDVKSEEYHLVSPEAMFSQCLSDRRFMSGVFGVDVGNYELHRLFSEDLKNYTPEAEKKLTKIFTDMTDYLRQDVPEVKLDEVKKVEIPDQGRVLRVYPVYATYLDKKYKVIYGSGPKQDGQELEGVPEEYFANSTTLHSWILDRYLGAFLRNYPNLQKEFYEGKLQEAESRNVKLVEELKIAEESKTHEEMPLSNPKSSKLNMLLEGSIGWRKIISNKVGRFGIYTGAELFFDFNPNEVYFDKKQCSLKENAIGIMPFLGIASKDNWMLYGLAGVKLSFKRIELEQRSFTRHKTEFELGVGTDYMLTKHVGIGFRYVHTFQSQMKFKSRDNSEVTLKTHSSKFLVTFSYMF